MLVSKTGRQGSSPCLPVSLIIMTIMYLQICVFVSFIPCQLG